MGFEYNVYIGPVFEVKEKRDVSSSKETVMVNSKGEEFRGGELYDPYTGEELKKEIRGDDEEIFYRDFMDAYDAAIDYDVYSKYLEDVDGDEFITPENDSSPKGYFWAYPDKSSTPSVRSYMIDPEMNPKPVMLDTIDTDEELEKFKRANSNVFEFLKKFFGEDNVKVRFVATPFVI